MDNQKITELLRNMAASYEILGENRFRINAYAQAADAVSALSISVKDIWSSNKLTEIPGVGGSIAAHLDELFRTGKSKHFEETFSKIPQGTFDLMKIRSIGPKTAVKLTNALQSGNYEGSTIYEKLNSALSHQAISKLDGFGVKREEDIKIALKQFLEGQTKKKRLLLQEADAIAQQICSYLKQDKNVDKVNILGSLRRKKDTIGDLDIAATTSNPTETIKHFVSYPGVATIVDQGVKGATIIVASGVQIDLRITDEKSYGAMLQYFTGSKYHNIKLREYALSKQLSISEHGIKKLGLKDPKPMPFPTEKEFYGYLGLPLIPPEMREDKGEIELAINSKLPILVETHDIKGDLHIHSNYDLSTSHDLGVSSFEVLLSRAQELKYEYIGLSDHNPKQMLSGQEIVAILKKRKEYFDNIIYSKEFVQKYNSIQKVFIMLEVDIKPDGSIALPEKAFDHLDAVLVSIHSSFTQDKDAMTKRVLKGLTVHPKVRVFAHPTGRLINSRPSIDLHWDEVFKTCQKNDIALEINAGPERLDLPDQLVFEAREKGMKFVIGTDAHIVDAMDNMKYGVSVARRGWSTRRDILNTLSEKEFSKWLSGSINH